MSEDLAFPQAPPAAPPPVLELGGFWRRAAAFAVDGGILLLLGALLGTGLGEQFRAMGESGRVVGFLIAAIYFTALDGPLGGRTPGKRLLGLRVTGADGEPLSWGAAALRGAPLGLIFALNGYAAEPDLRDPATAAISAFWLLPLVAIYLVAFERSRRQGPHDLAASSFVLRAASPWVEPPPASRGHLIAAIALPLLLAVLGAAVSARVAESALFKPLLAARAAVRARVGDRPVGVTRNVLHMNGETRTFLQISLFYFSPPADPEQIAHDAARAAIESGYPTEGLTGVNVSVVDGYTIGIASFWRAKGFGRTAAQWSLYPAHMSKVEHTTGADAGGLIEAAVNGTPEDLEKLLKAGVDPNRPDATGDTALLAAALKGRVDISRMLLDYSATANARNNSGQTPLMFASRAGNKDLASLLLERKADPDVKEDQFGKASIHYAVQAGHVDVIALLLSARASPNVKDNEGRTALWYARNRGHPELADMLIKAGAVE